MAKTAKNLALERELTEIESLNLAELRVRWEALEGIYAPTLPEGLLRRLLAQRLQERRLGAVPAGVLRELERIRQQRSGESEPAGQRKDRPALSAGTRLVREWNGRTISVEVRDDGFLYADKLYGSLSQIAGVVTGSKWSGPRFFGLTRHG